MKALINVGEFIGSTGSGGAETVVKDYACLADRNEFNIVVIVRRRELQSQNDRILSEKHIRIIPIYKNQTLLFRILQRLNDWWYIPVKLNTIIKRENLNILHIHLELLRHVNKIGKQIKNVKLFFTCHNEPETIFNDRRELEAAQNLINKNGLQLCALTEKMRDELNRLFRISNTIVLRNGIDFDRFQNVIESKEEIRNKLNIPSDAFVLGHVGRFVPQKNHDLLTDIFIEVAKKNQNAFLLMVGRGGNRERIEKKLINHHMLGKYLILENRTDIPFILKAMDVFLFPSQYEGLGIAFVEAEASGLKCIASDKIPKEAFISNKAMSISLNEPVSTWCEKVIDDQMSEAFKCDTKYYDLKNIILELESLYRDSLYDIGIC